MSHRLYNNGVIVQRSSQIVWNFSDNSRLLPAMNHCYCGDPSVSLSAAMQQAVLGEPACSTSPASYRGCYFSILQLSSAAAGSQHALGPCPFLTLSSPHATIAAISHLVKKVPSLELLHATEFSMRLV